MLNNKYKKYSHAQIAHIYSVQLIKHGACFVCQVKAKKTSAPVSARHGSEYLVDCMLHARLWRRRPATFTVYQSTAARRTTTSASTHRTWPSGLIPLRCYGSHGLELAARRPTCSTEQWLFLSAPKDFPFLSLLAYAYSAVTARYRKGPLLPCNV